MARNIKSGSLPIGWLAVAGLAANLATGEPLEVLNRNSFFRYHISYRPFPGTAADSTPEPGEIVDQEPGRWVRWGEPCTTPLPPPDWHKPGFDDSGWPRQKGPVLSEFGFVRRPAARAIFLRARFQVDDPGAAGELSLRLAFRGGATVYLNGREIGRAYLPKGRLTEITEATPYPLEVFVTPDGGALLPSATSRRLQPGLASRYLNRIRKAAFALKSADLRAGVNVLAVELRRAPLPPDLPEGKSGSNWDTVGLNGMDLVAKGGQGVTPNVAAPRNAHVWNAEPTFRPGVDAAHGDPFEPLRPVFLVAPRNGLGSGQVVVSAPFILPPVEAAISPLKQGSEEIPASAVHLRFSQVTEKMAPLLERPATNAITQPVWVLVNIPADASPGLYKGELRLNCGDKTFLVPVHLRVFGWNVGHPSQWRTVVNMLQSPESVAGVYQVPLWSDDHFRLMESSIALMGQAGNDVLGISAVAENVFGDDPLVVFRREDGRLVPELKFARRYLEIYDRVNGPPEFLALHVWSCGMYQRGAGRDGGKGETMAKTIKIHQLEGQKLETVEFPMYGQPGTAELWKQVMEGLREIVTGLGWREDCILLGTAGDTWPHESTVTLFKAAAPLAQWRAITHGAGVPAWGVTDAERAQPNRMVVGYLEQGREIANRRTPSPGHPVTCNARDSIGLDPVHYRKIAGLMVIGADYQGVCWDGIDYWNFTTPAGATRYALNTYERYGNSVGSTPRAMAYPGPNGAVPTVQFQMYREGIQDCEALIFLRDTLADDKLRARLSKRLRERAQAILTDLPAATEAGSSVGPQAGFDYRALVTELYATATEVATATGQHR